MTRPTPYGLTSPMPAPASLSTPTAAPTGFESVRETLSNLLLLLVIGMITNWAESLIASLRQRTDTTDLTDITRTFGTTDIALILERLTTGLQRLRALEDKVRRAVAGLDNDPQLESTSVASSPLSQCAPQPLGLTPEDFSILSLLAPEWMAVAPVRATGPPRTRRAARKTKRGLSILSHREAWMAPPCRFLLPWREGKPIPRWSRGCRLTDRRLLTRRKNGGRRGPRRKQQCAAREAQLLSPWPTVALNRPPC